VNRLKRPTNFFSTIVGLHIVGWWYSKVALVVLVGIAITLVIYSSY